MEDKETVPRALMQDFIYLMYFYRYLFCKRGKEVLLVIVFNFIIGLLPILMLIFFELDDFTSEQKLQFYGDGSLIIFCFGVLMSFVNFNFNFLLNKNEIEIKNISVNKALLFCFCLLYYFFSYKLFERAQLNFAKDWCFVISLNAVSFFFLIIAFFFVLYMKFADEIDYAIVNPFREEIIRKKQVANASKKEETKTENGKVKL